MLSRLRSIALKNARLFRGIQTVAATEPHAPIIRTPIPGPKSVTLKAEMDKIHEWLQNGNSRLRCTSTILLT
ncbi:hypothetical protein AB6A40_005653 [Gnathostoma spinigerum]|uniref:Uncharacterized protein n=1 Tax=Gnathostoma spinigerum TaxID=75299 RepID=A0ABD6EG23_9BILA